MILAPKQIETPKISIQRIYAEECISDERDRFSPAEHVQHKLQGLLPSTLIPVSSLHTSRPVRRFAKAN